MEIKDALLLKENLEKDILKLLNNFQQATELNVDNIYLEQVRYLNEHVRVIVGVDCSITFE